MLVLVLLSLIPAIVCGFQVNPIEVNGREFVDSVTRKRFFIKGVDYQPGGSSGYYGRSDPLSDSNICARDIFLFQKLGINAVRVYTVNPDLDHDECMTMLAAAGIYLILDINSPRIGESLNRYEPWTTYTPEYLEHILKVVHQFSGYNNTLGFFAGNEVINDDRSATNSPNYMKAVIRDVKTYIRYNSPRAIPVGYSAADDLRYRISLSKYLECGDDLSTVDFYGVNSYQWCGKQTYTSSGYNGLVKDYSDYSLPVFFSEYGCNAVTPRLFQEIETLYSAPMTSVFSGGLVYEFSQEPNNYGLVELDQSGNVYLLPDFDTLTKQFKAISSSQFSQQPKPKRVTRPKQCLDFYDNLNTKNPLPETFASSIIAKGLNVKRGQYVNSSITQTALKIYGTDDKEISEKKLSLSIGAPIKPIEQRSSNNKYDHDNKDSKGARDDDNRWNDKRGDNPEKNQKHVDESSAITLSSLIWATSAMLVSAAVIFYNGW